MEIDKGMVGSNGMVLTFMKATGATIALMADRFGVLVTSTILVP